MSNESVMPSNHLILCRSLLLLPSIFPCIRVFSNESALWISWSKYWSFSINPSNEYWGLIFFRNDWLDLLRVFNTTTQKHQFFDVQLSLWSNSHIHTWLLGKTYVLFIYLAALDLSCSMWELWLCHVNSYLWYVGSSFLTRDQTWAPCIIGSMES